MKNYIKFMESLLETELDGVAISIDENGTVCNYDSLTETQQTSLTALLAAYNPLDGIKAEAARGIDAKAEALRSTVLTPGAGQMAAYQEKERQARALLADAMPTEGEYPDIFNEIGITAASAGEVAMAVTTAAETWRTFGRLVERARLAGKKAVSEASDAAGVLAARDGIVWPQCDNPSLSSVAK